MKKGEEYVSTELAPTDLHFLVLDVFDVIEKEKRKTVKNRFVKIENLLIRREDWSNENSYNKLRTFTAKLEDIQGYINAGRLKKKEK